VKAKERTVTPEPDFVNQT